MTIMNGISESGLEQIESEEDDLNSSPAHYEIVTYPADYTLEGLVTKYRRGQIKLPGFQRKFVWKIQQASKLIESFLLGLPVPAIFLYTDPDDNTLDVIDGQQRLLSLVYYFEGYFGPAENEKRMVFSLKGLHEKSPYKDKTYATLEKTDGPAFNRLNDAVLRAFVVKQLNPKNHTSIYHVFERLNTGGTQLTSQEVRNCIYYGAFNELLRELNRDDNWRAIFGRNQEDNRQRDIELILRFFALFYNSEKYEKPMKDFLSDFMAVHRKESEENRNSYKNIFRSVVEDIGKYLDPKPFHIRAGLNAAVFDSVTVAFAKHRDKEIPRDIGSRYKSLIEDPKYLKLVSSSTTDGVVVIDRLNLAYETLFGAR